MRERLGVGFFGRVSKVTLGGGSAAQRDRARGSGFTPLRLLLSPARGASPQRARLPQPPDSPPPGRPRSQPGPLPRAQARISPSARGVGAAASGRTRGPLRTDPLSLRARGTRKSACTGHPEAGWWSPDPFGPRRPEPGRMAEGPRGGAPRGDGAGGSRAPRDEVVRRRCPRWQEDEEEAGSSQQWPEGPQGLLPSPGTPVEERFSQMHLPKQVSYR